MHIVETVPISHCTMFQLAVNAKKIYRQCVPLHIHMKSMICIHILFSYKMCAHASQLYSKIRGNQQ